MRGIETRERASGTAIYISYTRPGGRRIREVFRRVEEGKGFQKRLEKALRDARDERDIRVARLKEGRPDVPAAEPEPEPAPVPTFASYVSDYYISALQTGTNSARERMKERSMKVEIHRCTDGTLGRYFAQIPLNKINRTEIERFIAHRMSEGAGAAGINRDLARLRNLLNDATDRDELVLDLPRIPWGKLRQREEPKSWRPMRDDEEDRLLPQFRDRIVRDLVEFLTHTGIRPEAALALEWQHVDLEGQRITIPKAINKTHAYVVYVNSRVMEVLRGLYAWRPEALRQPDVTVFCHRNGKPRRSIRTAWNSACQAPGIEGLHVRGLRATASTRLQEAGANEFDVKLHLGHSVGAMGTTGRYIDPQERHRRAVAEMTVRRKSANLIRLPGRNSAGSGTDLVRATTAAEGNFRK